MIQDLHKSIGSRIRHFRKERGYTLVTFAQELHCSKSTVSKYERGEISLDIETLMKIAETLHVSLNQLLGEEAQQLPRLFSPAKTDGEAITKLYFYAYCGHKQAYFSRHVLLLGDTTASLYGEVADEEDYLNHKYYYSGAVHRTESFYRLLLVNPMLENDIVIIEFLKPLKYHSTFTGFFCTLSVGPYFPMCCKVIISENIITDENWLKQQLVFNKADLKTLRQLNAFSIDFATFPSAQ